METQYEELIEGEKVIWTHSTENRRGLIARYTVWNGSDVVDKRNDVFLERSIDSEPAKFGLSAVLFATFAALFTVKTPR